MKVDLEKIFKIEVNQEVCGWFFTSTSNSRLRIASKAPRDGALGAKWYRINGAIKSEVFPENHNLLLKLAAIELSSARTEPFEINFGNHIYERVLEEKNKIDSPTDNHGSRQKQNQVKSLRSSGYLKNHSFYYDFNSIILIKSMSSDSCSRINFCS